MPRDGRQLQNNSTQKNQPTTLKNNKKSENKEKKNLQKRNYSAYLGGKNVGRWKGGGEQFYKKESANNIQKTPKNTKQSENKRKKYLKSEIKGHTLVSKIWKTGWEQEQRSTGKNQQRTPKKTKKKAKKKKKIENKEKKHLKKGKSFAYLGEKNAKRWKTATEQFYTKKSANNSQKQQKKRK